MSNFRIGEKVVCVDDSPCREYETSKGMAVPKLNEMYTIRGFNYLSAGAGILIEEIINPIIEYADGTIEPVYRPNRFRKLDYEFAENLLRNIKEEVMQLTE